MKRRSSRSLRLLTGWQARYPEAWLRASAAHFRLPLQLAYHSSFRARCLSLLANLSMLGHRRTMYTNVYSSGTIRVQSVSEDTMPRCAIDLDLSISYCLNASRGDV